MKVVIADKMSDKAVNILTEAGFDVDARPSRGEIDLFETIGDADALVLRSNTKVTEELLAKAPKLRVIGRAGIGVDNVDVPAATKAGIVVMNTPFGNSITTAEHAIALMFAIARHIPQANQSTHAGKWEKNKFKGVELFNKNIGIVGCGNIGSIVANRAKALQMNVLAYDPFLTEEKAKDLGVKKLEFKELCEQSDFITFHTPLLPQTKYLLNDESFKHVKKGAYIINAARGGLVQESALLEALNNGQIAGAALDVFEVEPANDNALFNHPKVIVTPHLGASTNEAQENVAEQVAEQITALLKYNEIKNAINYPSLSAQEAEKLNPYFNLVDKLASFLGQTINVPIKKATIGLYGEAADLSVKPLKLKFIESLLKPNVSSVNSVNALQVAESRGIEVKSEENAKELLYTSLIKLTVTTEDKEHEIAGTLFNGSPRFVEIFNTPLEAGFSEHMIYIRNNNTPGVIGKVGTLLAEHNYNIENYHLGFSQTRNEALSLVGITKPLDDKTKKDLEKITDINRVVGITF